MKMTISSAEFRPRVVDQPLILEGFDGAFLRRESNGIRLELYTNFFYNWNTNPTYFCDQGGEIHEESSDEDWSEHEEEIHETLYGRNIASLIIQLVKLCIFENLNFVTVLSWLQENHIVVSEEVVLSGDTIIDFQESLYRECKRWNIDYAMVMNKLVSTGHLSAGFFKMKQGRRRKKKSTTV